MTAVLKPFAGRLLGFLFWVGVLCMCVPILMYVRANTAQWELRHQWTASTVRQHSTSSTGTTLESVRFDDAARLTALQVLFQSENPAVKVSTRAIVPNRRNLVLAAESIVPKRGSDTNNAGATTPQKAVTVLSRITIPKIQLDAMVVEDVTPESLSEGPGHFPETPLPGEPGNCVIAAHRNMWGYWFYHLDQLREGDQIILETRKRQYVYIVDGSMVVPPTDTSILDSDADFRYLTLITCTLPAQRRLVVHAVLRS